MGVYSLVLYFQVFLLLLHWHLVYKVTLEGACNLVPCLSFGLPDFPFIFVWPYFTFLGLMPKI